MANVLTVAPLLIVILLSILVTRVAAVAFTLTGMSPDVAQFQARAAFSSTGLGTAEAEQIVSHPARRRIYQTLMLLGNAGLVTSVASLSLSFTEVGGGNDSGVAILLLIVGLLVLVVVARNRRFAGLIGRVSERLLRKYTDLDVGDYAGLLHVGMNYGVNRVKVTDHHWMAGRALSSFRLTDEGVLVLGVERADGTYLGAPRGDTHVEAGDWVLVYGPGGSLAELHDRPAGKEGRQMHLDAVEASQTREAQERSRDTQRRRRLRREKD